MSQSDIMDLPNMIQANFSAETQKLQDRGLDSGVLSVFLTYQTREYRSECCSSG